MNRSMKAVSTAGFVVFAAIFLVCTLAPRWLEHRARAYVTTKVRSEILRERPALAGLGSLEGLGASLRERAARTKAFAESRAPDLLAQWLATLCKYDCGGQPALAVSLRASIFERLRRLDAAVERVGEWGRGRYDQMVSEVVRDLSIFSGCNAIMFLLALVSAWFSPREPKALAVVSGSLVAGALVGGGLYVFGQNWFYTLLFADYVGFAYAFWAATIVGILLDLILNRARIVRALMELTSAAVGSIGA